MVNEIKELYIKCIQEQTKKNNFIEIDMNIRKNIKRMEFKQILESEGVDYL